MASTGVNVLRWSALGLGLFYGVYHQAKISSKDKADAINREYQRKEDLIKKAKEEYHKKTSPPQPGSGLITDPEHPDFDLEAYLKAKAEEK
ncbi:F1F0 ATP synthase subunit e, mitochondrial [Botryosphaeria dothidea]